MSLKAFHVFFIIVSTLLAVSCGIWGMNDYLSSGDSLGLVMAIGSLIGIILLVLYFKWFLRKLKKVSYL